MINKLESIVDMTVDGIANAVELVVRPTTIAVLGIIFIGYVAHESNNALMQRMDYLNQELDRYKSSCQIGER